jgi:hypothetical protein
MKHLNHLLSTLLLPFALGCQAPEDASEPDAVTTIARAQELAPIDFTTIRINSETLNYNKNVGAALQRGTGSLLGNVSSNFFEGNIQVQMTFGPLPANINPNTCTFVTMPGTDVIPRKAQKVEYFTPLIASVVGATSIVFDASTRRITGTFPWFATDFMGALWVTQGVCRNTAGGDIIQRTRGGQFFIKGAKGCGSRGVNTSWCGTFNEAGGCWCDEACQNNGDCCKDYKYACTTN